MSIFNVQMRKQSKEGLVEILNQRVLNLKIRLSK